MIPLALILIASGVILLGFSMSAEIDKSSTVEVGSRWTDNDPFIPHTFEALVVSGDWVKFRRDDDAPTTYRSTKIATFRAWYPNQVKP